MSKSRPAPPPARTIIFLGISGSGKGTQAAFLLRNLRRAVNVSTGAEFRRVAKKNNLVGGYIRGVMRRGGLAPYWAPAYFWLTALFERLKGDEHLVFDGSPRRIEEARMLDDVMRDLGRELPLAVYLRLSARAARERLLARGRADDNRRAIAGRFNFFQAYVRPVIRYYRARRRLIVVNGEQSVQGVWRDIRTVLRLSASHAAHTRPH